MPFSVLRKLLFALLLILTGLFLSACLPTTPTKPKVPVSNTVPVIKTPLQNWGATQSSWAGDHTLDPILKTGYWPRLANGIDTYTNLTYDNSIVTGFTYNFYPPVSVAMARITAKGLLPIAAKILSQSPTQDTYSFAGATITVSYSLATQGVTSFVLSSPTPPTTTFQ